MVDSPVMKSLYCLSMKTPQGHFQIERSVDPATLGTLNLPEMHYWLMITRLVENFQALLKLSKIDAQCTLATVDGLDIKDFDSAYEKALAVQPRFDPETETWDVRSNPILPG